MTIKFDFIRRNKFSTKYAKREHNHTSDLAARLSTGLAEGSLVFEVIHNGRAWLTTLEPREVNELFHYIEKNRSKK